jgi:iron(III) transport system permease protein
MYSRTLELLNVKTLSKQFVIITGWLIIFSPLAYFIFLSSTSFEYTKLFQLLFTDRRLSLMSTTLTIAAGSAFTSVFIGGLLAFLLIKTNLPFCSILQKALIIPFLIPPYLQAVVWVRLFQELNISQALGLDIHSTAGAIFIHSASMFSLAMIIIGSGLRSISRDLEEAAQFSLSPLQCFRRITLPLVAPNILIAFMLIFILTMNNFEVADSLRLNTYPMEIFISYSAYYNDLEALYLSLPLVTISLLIIGAIAIIIGKKKFALIRFGTVNNLRYSLGKFRVNGLVIVGLVLMMYVITPIVSMFYFSLNIEATLKLLVSSKRMIFETVSTCLLTAVTVTVFSCLLGETMIRSRFKFRVFNEFILAIPFGIPSITFGIAIIKLWNQPFLNHVYSSQIILIVGGLITLPPFIVQLMKPALLRVDRSAIRLTRFSQASKARLFFYIILPMYRHALIIGITFSFVIYLSCLGITLLIMPPGSSTLPVSIYNYMHYGSEQAVHTLGLTLLSIMFITISPLICTGDPKKGPRYD